MTPLKSVRYSRLALAGIAAIATLKAQTKTPEPDKSTAYYQYSLGHFYSELAGAYGNKGDYVNKAIEAYRAAMKADPGATFLSEELSDLYIQSGRLRDAVVEAEENIKQNPNDVSSRRILGRIYTRMIGDSQQGRLDEGMLKKAIDQYQKVTELAPTDLDTWLMLGRLQKIASNSVEAEKAYKKALELEPENEDAMSGLAMVYADLGNNKAATDLLRKVADKNPSLRTLTNLAANYEGMHEYALAAETLRRTIQMAPGNNEVKRAFAQNLMLSEQFPEALKQYEELVAEDPRDIEAQLRISQIYREQRNFAKAREAANKAKQIDPANLEVRYNDVNLLDAEGKTAEAITALKDMLASGTKRTYNATEKVSRIRLLERLALLYRSNEQPHDAIDAFRQIGDLDKDMAPRAAAQIIDTYRLAKEYKKAEQEADSAIKQYPDDRAVRATRASLLADVGRGEEAVSETKKLFDGKNDRETYIALAQVYDKTKNYNEMAKALDAADKLSQSPEDRENIAFMRGAMYEKQKKFEAAESEFRKVLENNPKNASALNYLGYMLADRNVRLQEAHQLVSKALEADPNNGAYLDSLGWVYYKMDKLPEAERNLRLAMERYSKDPTVHDHLGDVLFKEGKIKEAIAQWQASIKEWDNTAASEMEPAELAKVQKKLENAKVRLAKENGGQKP